MNDELVERIAARVVELIRADAPPLLDAAEVARRLGRSRDYVYAHRSELGAVPLGDGPRPRLGFPAERVADYSSGSRAVAPESRNGERRPPARRRGRNGQGRDLLPIKRRETPR